MPSAIDLHTHTTASDGTLAPAALLAKAAELRIQTLAISDHDTTAGLEAVLPLLPQYPQIRLIPALEMSAEGDMHCHLLAYYIDIQAPGFQDRLRELRENRLKRIQAMTEKISALGFAVDFGRVVALAGGGTVGRPHLADAMVEKRYVRTRKEAFDRFLKHDAPAFLPGVGPSAAECIALIRSAGGVPVLAHPSYYTSPELLKKLADAGLMGLEVYYPEHSRSLMKRYLELGQSLNLIPTGGSDFHGPKTHRNALACVDVPATVLDDLERARAKA